SRRQARRSHLLLRAIRPDECEFSAVARRKDDHWRRVRTGAGGRGERPRNRFEITRKVAVSPAGPVAAPGLGPLRLTAAWRRKQARGIHGSQPRLQTPVPSLSGRARI